MNFKINFFIILAFFNFNFTNAQPELTSWILNSNGKTGYNGISSNIQKLQYSANYIYVSASCIPGYDIGPWTANPNKPSNQNFVFKITRKPVKNNNTPTKVGLGHVGIWSNGVSIYNASDGMSYNSAGVWNRNAYFFEGISFDNCLGHAAQNGEYHHHVSPKCLYDSKDSSKHSPIIGYAWDGFPIYGAYAYSNLDGTGKIKRMTAGYQLKNLVTRANGPNPDQTYPLGCFMEDHEYIAGSGDLDERNGRYCVTPDYPNGIYAYFVTIDQNQTPVFPYVMYNNYYGVVTPGNMGPGSGHVTISETVDTYVASSSGLSPSENKININLYPNPNHGTFFMNIEGNENNFELFIYNHIGEIVYSHKNLQPNNEYPISMEKNANGIYFAEIKQNNQLISTQKIILNR
jgi:hypothetical protein